MASAARTGTAPVIEAEALRNSVADAARTCGVKRYFTIPGRDPFDEIEWELRDAFIPGKDGPVFEQKGVEFPKFCRRRRRTSSRKSTSAVACPRPSASRA